MGQKQQKDPVFSDRVLVGCLNKKDILRKLCGFKGKEAALPLWQLLQPDLPFIY